MIERRILIVDDDDFNILGLKIKLNNIKYNGRNDKKYDSLDYLIDTACNGKEAVDLVKRSHSFNNSRKPFTYGLIFMDLSMPIMDGFEATERIRELQNLKNVPQPMIIACTGHCEEEFILKAWRYQFDEVVQKPTDNRILTQILNQMIQTNHIK